MSRTLLLIFFLTFAGANGQDALDPNRINRSPQVIIDSLFDHYGKRFRGSYVEALSVVVRLREKGIEAVEPIVADGLRNPAKLRGGSQIAGRLIFAEMAGSNDQAKKLVIEAADLAFDDEGNPLPAMPFHNEMSDAVFMAGPLLAKAGTLTGNPKYYDQSIRHFRFIRKLCLRKDGIYRHSPLDESAWGRGNGFPAIGLAMILEELPADHSERAFVVGEFQKHLAALKPHQDKNGMWHQVIDHPESYPEFTCTCMFSYAALVGIRLGILEKEEWAGALEKSWTAIRSRIGIHGKEVNGACTGTGKQKNLEAYLKRKEIHGYDDRSGSMALLFALEMKKFGK